LSSLKKRSGSGSAFQKQLKALLESQRFEVQNEVSIGKRLGRDGDHRIDLLAGNETEKILISCKYQHEPGTAIDKIPYEYLCLVKALEDEPRFSKAYIVVKGKELEGMLEKDFTIVLYADSKFDDNGKPEYFLHLAQENTSAKCPPMIFGEDVYKIPNDAKMIYDKIIDFVS